MLLPRLTRMLVQPLTAAHARASAVRCFSAYPDHEVHGLPALSPTMEAGTIGAWNFSEGDSFEAGAVLAEIETDKATMGFEAQDPGVIAKILVQPGVEVKVGQPIVVIMDEDEDGAAAVAAFKDFTVDEPAADAAPAAEAAPAPEAPPAPPVAAAAPPPPPPPPAPAASPAPAAPEDSLKSPSPAPAAAAASPTVYSSPQWGTMVKKSALANMLALDQKAYIEKYGGSGQAPIA